MNRVNVIGYIYDKRLNKMDDCLGVVCFDDLFNSFFLEFTIIDDNMFLGSL